jgi:hypothetical protein
LLLPPSTCACSIFFSLCFSFHKGHRFLFGLCCVVSVHHLGLHVTHHDEDEGVEVGRAVAAVDGNGDGDGDGGDVVDGGAEEVAAGAAEEGGS